MADWRKDILSGITTVPRLGIPGPIIVFGEKSEPILTNINAEIFFAAAEIGTGRVVVFSQDAYTKEFLKSQPMGSLAQLIKNTNSWVTRGTLVNNSDVHNMDSYQDFDKVPASCKVLVWVGNTTRTSAFFDKLMAWLKAGGGMVCGITPWGYLQLNPGKTLLTMPLYQVLKNIDICYTEQYLSGSGDIVVSQNQADRAHLLTMIKNGKDNINSLVTNRKNFENIIKDLPADALSKVEDDLTAMIQEHISSWHCIPSKGKPVTTPQGKSLTSLMNHLYIRQGEYNGKDVADKASDFPGDFPTSPTLITASVSATNNSQPTTSYPTGYYLPAGQSLVVTRLSSNTKPWSVVIGAHSDQLYHVTANWQRWPHVQVVASLTDVKTNVRSPFGGFIFLRCPDRADDTLTVTLQSVVPAPFYDVTVLDTIGDWLNRRDKAGLWSSVAGEAVVITMPSSSVRALPEPSSIMSWWDLVWRAHVDLRGKDPHRGRRQWVVTDQQPSAGYMHAGYPVVTGLDVADPNKGGADPFLLNEKILRATGAWGMFHELGHNIQDSNWTFSGTGEVTCNIFTLHAMETLTGQKPWTHPWLAGQKPGMKNYLLAGADFNRWKREAGTALGIYAQQARDFHWVTFKSVFREYDNLTSVELPKTDDDKVDQWITRFSKKAGKNLCPMFDFWGFPIRKDVQDALAHLPKFLHSDETTNEMAPLRAAEIRRKYGMTQF